MGYVIVDETVRNFNRLLTIKNITSMERVGALIHKLNEQYDQNVDKKNLLVTAQLLLAELEQETAQNASIEKVSVILPKVQRIAQDVPNVEPVPVEQPDPVKVPEQKHEKQTSELPESVRSYVLKPPQQPVQPSRPAPDQQEKAVQSAGEQPQPTPPAQKTTAKKEEQSGWLFDPVNEVPTLTHQKEIYELNDVHIDGDSMNDKLKEEKTELGATIKSDSVKDLRRAIGINDRYRFINELFRGDEAMYERSIKTINGFTDLAEAQSWIQRELKVKIGWNETNATVKDFDQMVKRRFS
jgi:outer membrane biosynthesis protein TonB